MSDAATRKEPTGQKNVITLEMAGLADVDKLIHITRVCFPDQIAWNLRSLASDFWSGVLGSTSSETWIWYVNGEAAAYSHMAVDVALWAAEKSRYNYGLGTKLYALLTNPGLALLKAGKAVGGTRSADIYKPSSGDSRERVKNKCQEFLASSGKAGDVLTYGGISFDPGEVLWVERAGILPEFRKLGLALRLMQFSDKKARELEREAVCGMIEAAKSPWCLIHERFGYASVYHGAGRHTFLKVLD
jgi:hypothetical protein